jgi:hypothetical protein
MPPLFIYGVLKKNTPVYKKVSNYGAKAQRTCGSLWLYIGGFKENTPIYKKASYDGAVAQRTCGSLFFC